ncbi:hypothetical protein [Paenibacillus eucommiae]|uniref:HEPN domain-containing protein n=1 Tax=Paenibacillus eucommiae TaxID=1355755 RepID=A0ABS4IVR9_9BACL|nr:hypothetical protein [Paenibacillus eucommiae]MBP1991667.1 hypothetical protein [Paenibacillus eucommiae]
MIIHALESQEDVEGGLLNPSSNLQFLRELSVRNMSLALLFLNHGMHEQCISLAAAALRTTLKAAYVKQYGSLPLHRNSLNEWIACVRELGLIDLDTELFIHLVCLLSSDYETVIAQRPPDLDEVRKLFEKVDTLVGRLSAILNVE